MCCTFLDDGFVNLCSVRLFLHFIRSNVSLVLSMCVDKLKIVTRLNVRINDSKIGGEENYMFRNKKIVAKERTMSSTTTTATAVERNCLWFPSICQFW